MFYLFIYIFLIRRAEEIILEGGEYNMADRFIPLNIKRKNETL